MAEKRMVRTPQGYVVLERIKIGEGVWKITPHLLPGMVMDEELKDAIYAPWEEALAIPPGGIDEEYGKDRRES
jgi:hypothetical protein